MIVETIVNERLSIWFDQNPSVAKVILAKIIKQQWPEMLLGRLEKMYEERCFRIKWLPGKLADCQIGKQEGTSYLL